MGKPTWDNLLIRFSVASPVVLATVAVSIALFVSDRIKRDAIDEVIGHAALGALGAADFEGPMAGERLSEFDRTQQPKESSCHSPLPSFWASSSTGDETAAQLGEPMMSRKT